MGEQSGITFDPHDDEDTIWGQWTAYCASKVSATSCLYGFLPTIHTLEKPTITRSMIFRHNHPQDYVNTIESDALMDGDPTTLRLIQDEPWFLWEDVLDWPGVTPEQRARDASDRAKGMKAGVSIRMTFFDGRGFAGIGLSAGNHTDAEFRRIWMENKDEVLVAARLFDAAMRPRMIANRFQLTSREQKVVALLAGGMSTKEVAHKLGLATKSVFNLTTRARQKLKSTNNLEAVTKALAFELI